MKSTYHQRTKIVWRTNPISGHSWPEHIPLKGFTVVHKFGRKNVRSEKAAIQACEDYDKLWELVK